MTRTQLHHSREWLMAVCRKQVRPFHVAVITVIVTLCSFSNSQAQTTLYPGGDWYDTNGNPVHAVEGGIMKVGSLYYLWGMDRSQNNYTFRGVNMYSSPDLKTWTFVN